MKAPILLLFILASGIINGQGDLKRYQTKLTPHDIKGRSLLKRNLTFGEYSTTRLRRSPASIFYIGTINPLNPVARIGAFPLVYKERYQRKDIYRFQLKRGDSVFVTVETKASLKVREQFSPFSKNETLTTGINNIETLEASILHHKDTSSIWKMSATNLDGSSESKQMGTIKKGDEEITFRVENLLLPDEKDKEDGKPNFVHLHKVYAFSFKGETIGAVSVYITKLKFWIKESEDQQIKDIIAAAASVLSFRQNLYK